MNEGRNLPALMLAVALLVVSCGAPAPSTQPPASDFDMSGTAWRATSVNGQEVPAQNAPGLEFDWLWRPEGRGFTGCDQFGFLATFEGGRVSFDELPAPSAACDAPAAEAEAVFLAALGSAETWSVAEDRLVLAGPGSQIVLARELPPEGDPSRELADALADGEWRFIAAPGVAGLGQLPPVLFTDSLFIAAGECGFSGDIKFGSGGTLDIVEVGWDVAGCGGADDIRLELKDLLEAVTRGHLGADGTIVLSGPVGEVVLGR
ncbi:MAG TPA: META domain-containing protein [Candidatus Limnocylindrales bacterium]|jgi:heat shock protein HslJ|nr:META domain-containing protein [Candidatus Limnocylindrales bacterium]